MENTGARPSKKTQLSSKSDPESSREGAEKPQRRAADPNECELRREESCEKR